MGVLSFLKDERFSVFFSFVLGLGLVCMFRPQCKDGECDVLKPPTDKDFEKYVYKLSQKCYEFKSEIVECPSSGTVEAFRQCSAGQMDEPFRDQFSRRDSPIKRCE
jgi:hypothetical protein